MKQTAFLKGKNGECILCLKFSVPILLNKYIKWNFRGLRCGTTTIWVVMRQRVNNSNTNEDIATKSEQGYVRCVINEKECVCSRCIVLISGKIIKEMPVSVVSGTHCIIIWLMKLWFILQQIHYLLFHSRFSSDLICETSRCAKNILKH